MGDDSIKTILGTFTTREAADRAIEHLVQEHGINRADVFVQAADAQNTAGTAPSGVDASQDEQEGSSFRPALQGGIEVSADVKRQQIEQAEQAFRSAGAVDVLIR